MVGCCECFGQVEEDEEYLYDQLGGINSFRKVIINQNEGTIPENSILLDTCAEINIFKDKHKFEYVELADEPIRIEGVDSLGGTGVYATKVGKTDFGVCYYNPRVIGNILSFGQCVDELFRIRYFDDEDYFLLQPDPEGIVYKFERFKDAANIYMYIDADPDQVSKDYLVAVQTVSENLSKYSKREIARANVARDYLRRLAYATPGMLIKMINNNKIKDLAIGKADVARCVDIYGKDLGNLKGKSTRNKPTIYEKEFEVLDKVQVKAKQILYIDIMFLNGTGYLITKTSAPLNYRSITKIKARNTQDLFISLRKILIHHKKMRLEVCTIRCDSESGVASEDMDDKLLSYDPSIEIDLSTGGEPVARIEREIRTIKERARAIMSTLPYMLDHILEEWMLKYIIYMLNWTPSSDTVDWSSPFERILGRSIDANIELKYGFGDYVQIGEADTNNSMQERTRGALALLPTGQSDGAWYFLVLSTWRVVKRQSPTTLPLPNEVIGFINGKVEEHMRTKRTKSDTLRIGIWRNDEVRYLDDVEEEYIEEADKIIDDYIPHFINIDPNDYEPIDEEVGQESGEYYGNEDYKMDVEPAITNEEELIEDIFGPDSDKEDHTKEGDLSDEAIRGNDIIEGEDDVDKVTPRYNLRPNRPPAGRWKAMGAFKRIGRNTIARNNINRYRVLNMTIKQAIKRQGYEAVKSIVAEVMQLYDNGTFEGIEVDSLTPEDYARIISSSMFLKEKYRADGTFEKLKARLVAGGHLQDRAIYDNGGSPTATTTSIFAVANIAAMEKRSVAHVDFPSAFLNATMPDDPGKHIYMRLNKYESMVLAKIDPSYTRFLRNGKITVKLKRALYGCVESARLWYDKLSGDLLALGFKKNAVDMCIFNRMENDGTQSTIALHVDDCLITAATSAMVDKVISDIRTIYSELTVHRGPIIDYIGMNFDFTIQGKVTITMSGYINDLLEQCNDFDGIVNTPASKDLFTVNENSVLLTPIDRERFHSVTAKLLYLAKRVRPDLLTSVSFLTKRVNAPTNDDMNKLKRAVKYLRGTKDMGIVLEATVNLGVFAYVDASYGVHDDMKSHTGSVIGIGKGPLYAKSSTQKINSKSSTEAELIGLSDSTNQIVWVRNFLIEQGYSIGPATVYQDNKSTISLVKNGKSNSERTRHIAIRFYFVADRVASKEITIEYMETSYMLADILTKPLQGNLFIRLRNVLLNWPTSDV